MEIIKHRSYQALVNAAFYAKKEIYETAICWSFRIYENRQTKYFHVFYKP